MVHLDSLQNPPIKKDLMEKLVCVDYPNYQAIIPNAMQKIQKENGLLSEYLEMKIARPFTFSYESFFYLLSILTQKYKVALVLSSHPLLYYAYCNHFKKEEIIALIPQKDSGEIKLDEALNNGANCVILPYLNEDILTSNLHLDSKLKDVFCIWDISYALALKMELPQNADIFLANGENLGLMRGYGILACKESDFYGDFGIFLEIENLYAIFLEAIKTQKVLKDDVAKEFFLALKEILGEDCSFAFKSVKNTLPLRLKGSIARKLIQAVFFDEIKIINGIECLLGFAKPSFVLQLMGYTKREAREFLSISFLQNTADLKKITNKIARKYQQLKEIEE